MRPRPYKLTRYPSPRAPAPRPQPSWVPGQEEARSYEDSPGTVAGLARSGSGLRSEAGSDTLMGSSGEHRAHSPLKVGCVVVGLALLGYSATCTMWGRYTFDATHWAHLYYVHSSQVGDGFATMRRKLLPFDVDAPCPGDDAAQGRAGAGGDKGGTPCAAEGEEHGEEHGEEAGLRGDGGEQAGAQEGSPMVQGQDSTTTEVTAVCTIEWDGLTGARVRFGRDGMRGRAYAHPRARG